MGGYNQRGITIQRLWYALFYLCSQMDPSVEMEESTVIRKTFSEGEEVMGFISGVSACTVSTRVCV